MLLELIPRQVFGIDYFDVICSHLAWDIMLTFLCATYGNIHWSLACLYSNTVMLERNYWCGWDFAARFILKNSYFDSKKGCRLHFWTFCALNFINESLNIIFALGRIWLFTVFWLQILINFEQRYCFPLFPLWNKGLHVLLYFHLFRTFVPGLDTSSLYQKYGQHKYHLLDWTLSSASLSTTSEENRIFIICFQCNSHSVIFKATVNILLRRVFMIVTIVQRHDLQL